MTEALWHRIKAAFLEASEMPREKRVVFLQELAREDEWVAEYVESLLCQPDSGGVQVSWNCWELAVPPAAPMLKTGAVLGARFEILGFVGAGGAGEVYRARDHSQDELLALKILKPEVAPDSEVESMLRNEFYTARVISHRNVCHLHEFHSAVEGAPPFMTMEFLDGDTLRNRIESRGPVATGEAAPIAAQIMDGLEAAHAK